MLEASGYRAMLADGSEEGEDRWANLLELREVTTRYDDLSPDDALDRLLEETALVADQDAYQGEADAVTLITLHAAKGLEFPVVFIAGLEEGLFPHNRALDDEKELEEERRLAYVGITRAKRRLYLSHAWRRATWGGGGMTSRPGSCSRSRPSSWSARASTGGRRRGRRHRPRARVRGAPEPVRRLVRPDGRRARTGRGRPPRGARGGRRRSGRRGTWTHGVRRSRAGRRSGSLGRMPRPRRGRRRGRPAATSLSGPSSRPVPSSPGSADTVTATGSGTRDGATGSS